MFWVSVSGLFPSHQSSSTTGASTEQSAAWSVSHRPSGHNGPCYTQKLSNLEAEVLVEGAYVYGWEETIELQMIQRWIRSRLHRQSWPQLVLDSPRKAGGQGSPRRMGLRIAFHYQELRFPAQGHVFSSFKGLHRKISLRGEVGLGKQLRKMPKAFHERKHQSAAWPEKTTPDYLSVRSTNFPILCSCSKPGG